MTDLNQAAMNVLSCASELVASLALAKAASQEADAAARGAAMTVAIQAREKLKDAVGLFEREHQAATGASFRSRCTWTFEMPPIAPSN